jgi:hypothetical protein
VVANLFRLERIRAFNRQWGNAGEWSLNVYRVSGAPRAAMGDRATVVANLGL